MANVRVRMNVGTISVIGSETYDWCHDGVESRERRPVYAG